MPIDVSMPLFLSGQEFYCRPAQKNRNRLLFQDPEPGQPGDNGPEPGQSEANGPEPGQSEAGGPEPDQSEAKGTEPDQSETTGPEPDQSETTGPEPDQPQTTKPEPDQSRTNGPEPDQPQANGPEPDRSESAGAEPDQPSTTQPEPGRAKKRVTFADSRGLALTRVKLFSALSDPIIVPLGPAAARPGSGPAARPGSGPAAGAGLQLDFPPPAADYLRFRQQLEQNGVVLERCALNGSALTGSVRVQNRAFQKNVLLRLSCDGWRSHTDVACRHLPAGAGAASDAFGFSVALPAGLAPPQRVEFAVCYRVGGAEHWDSNQGRNYGLAWSGARPDPVRPDGAHWDRYGSPTCSHGLLPDRPSWAGYEHLGPYY